MVLRYRSSYLKKRVLRYWYHSAQKLKKVYQISLFSFLCRSIHPHPHPSSSPQLIQSNEETPLPPPGRLLNVDFFVKIFFIGAHNVNRNEAHGCCPRQRLHNK